MRLTLPASPVEANACSFQMSVKSFQTIFKSDQRKTDFEENQTSHSTILISSRPTWPAGPFSKITQCLIFLCSVQCQS